MASIEERVIALEKDVAALKDGDAKFGGFMQIVSDFWAKNPKLSQALLGLVMAVIGMATAWVAARNNSLPGVLSEPTPPTVPPIVRPNQRPSEKTEPKTEPKTDVPSGPTVSRLEP